MSLKLTMLTAAAALLISASAHAEYGRQRLAIELLAAPDEAPGLVCVVHRALPKAPRVLVSFEGTAPLWKDKDDSLFQLDPIQDEANAFSVQPPTTPCPDASPAEGVKLTAAERAACLLQKGGIASTCSAERCAPVVKIEREEAGLLQVTCAEGVSGDPERVLVLKLQLPGDREGEVYGVSLDGTVVSVDGIWGTRRPSASVVGGHYHPANAASARYDNRMQLRVEAMCTRRLLEMPAIVRGAGQGAAGARIELYPDGRPPSEDHPLPDACKKTLCTKGDADQTAAERCITHSVPVMTARDPRGSRVAATLHLPSNGSCNNPAVEDPQDCEVPRIPAEARVDSDERQGTLRMQLYSVRFNWVVRCEYHGPLGEECPAADLIEAGVHCKSRRFGAARCEYTCEVPNGAAPMALPVTVRFAASGQENAWREQLTHIDQTLSGYTPLSERLFSFAPEIKDIACMLKDSNESVACRCPDDDDELSGKCETRVDNNNEPTGACICTGAQIDQLSTRARRFGDQVNKLTVWTPSGLTYEFDTSLEASSWPIVTVPGGRCDAPLTYRFSGTRSFAVAGTKIMHGQILLPSPDASAEKWSWGGLAALALSLPLVGDLSLDQPANHPGVHVKLSGRVHPLRSGWTFEGGVTGLFSNVPYYGLQLPDASADLNAASSAGSWRVGAEFAGTRLLPASLFFDDGWGVGFLVGVGVRLPAYRSNKEALGSSQLYLTAGAFIRTRITGPLWLDATAQYMALERFRHFSSDTLLGTVSVNSALAHTFVLSIGPRFWF